MVDGETELVEVSGALSREPIVALDTEFVRESTYYPKLCLIQVATTELAACVDFLADVSLAPLEASLFRDDCTWVVHSARQDLEVLWQQMGKMPARLVDTQIAASLLGFAPQLSLQALLAETLQVELGKGFARTDWSRRPLPAEALRYALDDVRHLLPLWRHLEEELNALGRLAWFEEDSQALLTELPVTDPLTIWGRLKSVSALSVPQQCSAYALVGWREKTAQRVDRPRRWIMSDELLVRIAASLPRDSRQLAELPEMPPRLAARSGGEILAALAERDDPEIRMRIIAAGERGRPDKERVKLIKARVRERARELGIHTEVLATRREIAALSGEEGASSDAVTGWRAEQLSSLMDD
jgi:ribonuclease D